MDNLSLPAISVSNLYPIPNNDFRYEFNNEIDFLAINESEKSFGNNIIILIDNKKKGFYNICILANIVMKIKGQNSYKMRFKALQRVELVNYFNNGLFLTCEYKLIEPSIETNEDYALIKIISKELTNRKNILINNQEIIFNRLSQESDLNVISDMLTFNLKISEEQKLKYILETNLTKRLTYIVEDLKFLDYVEKLDQKINDDVRKNIEDSQKEYYLRERMRAIQEELGDKGKKDEEIEELREKIKKAKLPKSINEKALNELRRYETMPQANAESNVIKSYLDFIVDLPWHKQSKDNTDLNKTLEKLNENHYGLEKVKQRIIEYLGVKVMTQKNPQTILCLVGPPGVGKTSLAISIADALGRKFVRQSLGGLKDEAEIKGHRRTYVGALPGRILNGMRNAKTINPVFLLDEIDKMAQSYRGDPASAMLEVLDPEQNSTFSDYYLEEPYDLSQVLFITTANYLGNIPEPLRDRMEIIELNSYTEQEKYNICEQHLIPKQIKAHGLKPEEVIIDNDVIYDVIRYYTREAGVRDLNRNIGSLLRKGIMKLLTKEIDKIHITTNNLEEYLGKKIFTHHLVNPQDQIGIVTGLAYTSFGGDTLSIEVTYYKGSGKLVLTGKLGDVMKESAMAALSYVRSNCDKYHIDPNIFIENDIHIHVPEGAVPKDGPSAGVTIATAIISAVTKRYVRNDLGMTGEITLRGNVLPIGGLKEKSIAAHRSGLKCILIPKENERDIDDIPAEVRKVLDIIPVDNVEQVIKKALR